MHSPLANYCLLLEEHDYVCVVCVLYLGQGCVRNLVIFDDHGQQLQTSYRSSLCRNPHMHGLFMHFGLQLII